MIDNDRFTIVLHILEGETGAEEAREAGEPTAHKQRHAEFSRYVGNDSGYRVFLHPDLGVVRLGCPQVASITFACAFERISNTVEHRLANVPAGAITESVPRDFAVFPPVRQVAA